MNDNEEKPKNPKVRQLGLTCKNGEYMEAFADRVSEYNKEKGFVVVELEATEADDGHWDLVMEFKSRSYARDFWTDPKYQTNVIV
jgi:uncharacterized protein (DUF1330 family)